MESWVPVLIVAVIAIGWFAIRAGEKEKQRGKVRIFCDSCGATMAYGRWKVNDGCANCDSGLFFLDRSSRGRDEGLNGFVRLR